MRQRSPKPARPDCNSKIFCPAGLPRGLFFLTGMLVFLILSNTKYYKKERVSGRHGEPVFTADEKGCAGDAGAGACVRAAGPWLRAAEPPCRALRRVPAHQGGHAVPHFVPFGG